MRDLQFTASHLPSPEGRAVQMTLTLEEARALLSGYDEATVVSELEIDLRLTPITGAVQLTGRLACAVEGACGRCLKGLPVAVDVNVSTMFMPQPRAETLEAEVELAEEDLDLSFYASDKIDLAGFIREAVILEMPGYPLCEPDCPGLCSQCGQRRDGEDCGCDERGLDPRLAPLLAIKQKLEES